MKAAYFSVLPQRYSAQQDIKIDKGCNGYTARNIGDTPVMVNGVTLLPAITPGTTSGESFAVSGNFGELFAGRISVQFLAPAGTNPLVEVIQKYYLPETLKNFDL